MRRGIWVAGVVTALVMVAAPVGADHIEPPDANPFFQNGQTFTAEVDQPFLVGWGWAACTADQADDLPTWPDLTGPTLEVN